MYGKEWEPVAVRDMRGENYQTDLSQKTKYISSSNKWNPNKYYYLLKLKKHAQQVQYKHDKITKKYKSLGVKLFWRVCN